MLVAAGQRETTRRLWVHGPIADVALGWCWLPIALIVHAAEPHLTTVRSIMGVIFLISFAHQPLTLGLVYGDPMQRGAHRRLYRWAPWLAFVLIVIGLNVSLTAVALMAGLWNAEHTLMQRYGVMRIYGRKVGDEHARLEKPMLIVWLVAAISYIGGYVDLHRLVSKLGFGGTNARSVKLLGELSPYARVLFWVAAPVGVVLVARWWKAERRIGTAASRPKHWYALGTAGLVVAVMVDPIAGVAGYVAAHAIEYFAVVHSSLRKRSDAAPIATVTRSPARRAAVYVAYFVAIGALVYLTKSRFDGRLYAFAVLFFGALHILYDGFVWKLRRPSVAASLGISPS
ncbi:MAG: hypothetical protein ABI949_03880 [Ilumatobacteraceae bacterium]